MVKSIKKSIKYLIIFFGIIIALPTLLAFVLRMPGVQTMVVRRITDHISEEFKSTLSVGEVNFQFFNKLNMSDILIKDQNDDTLIYTRKLSAVIRKIDLKEKQVILGKVGLTKPFVAFITDSSGTLNLRWYIDKMMAPGDTLKKTKNTIAITQIAIDSGRFSMVNLNRPAGRTLLDLNNLRLSGVSCILEDFKIQNDTTSFSVYDLGFRGSEGFLVRRMNSEVVIAKNNILFNSAFVNCDSSILNVTRAGISADSSFKDFFNDVKLDILLDRSLVYFSDLRYFAPFADGIDESVWISGKVMGTVSELRGRNVVLSWMDHTFLDCDFDISGLPEIENSFIYFGINSLRSNSEDIRKIDIPGKGPIRVPEFFDKLATFSFSGSFTGFTTDFVAYGKLRTAAGSIKTDISMRPEESNSFRVSGLITGSDVDLGYLAEKPDLLGNMSMRANVDGVAYSLKEFSGSLSGMIDSIELNKYTYRNIGLNGVFTEKTWDGNVKITDSNIRMDILGMFNFNRELPEFDFTLNLANADLNKLNIDKADTAASLSMLLTANIKGNNIDNIDGEIKLLNSRIKRYGNTLDLYNFSIKTFAENSKPAINLRTDYIDADLRGYYDFTELGILFKRTLASLMPSRFTRPVESGGKPENNFTFNINFKNTDRLNIFFNTGILMSDKSYLNGAIFTDSIMMINGEAKTLSFRNNTFNNLSLEGNVSSNELSLGLKSTSLNLLGQSDLKGFSANLSTKPDTFLFDLGWDNQDKILNRGKFSARGMFSRKENENPVLSLEIDSTDIYSRNKLWKINNSLIALDSSSLKINKLYINNKEHYYLVDGSVSEDPSDTLHVEFRGIDISPLNYLTGKKGEANRISLGFRGELNGNVLLTGIYRNLLLVSNIQVNDFSMLESDYGDLEVISAWDSEKRVAQIHAGNNLEGKKMLDINGHYDPVNKKIFLDGVADKLPIDALNPLLRVFASGISGTATGKVNLSGESDQLMLRGALMVEDASMKIDYLQTRYSIRDSIRFAKNKIIFNNVKLIDERGKIAVLNGAVNHRYFKEYSADMMITLNESMAINTKPKDNDLFYGTAFGTGVATIRNNATTLSFDISAKTDRNTRFYIPLNSSETVSDYSYISFIDHDAEIPAEVTTEKTAAKPVPDTKVVLNFDLEVTPEAEVQLIFDSKVGDVMKGHGSGNLNININEKGDFKISGDYIIEDGDYLFTLGNIFNKPFSVENGGTITFNGDIDNAIIDIKAIYKLKASLSELLQDERYNERIPVECQIRLSGNLFNPIVGLDIVLPIADEATKAYLRSVITTEEELSRQFLYLLVMNSFYSDPSYGSTLTTTTTTGTSAMAVTTTEMVSNQLSNWVSQISNDFDVGFVYRPGYKDLNSNEVQLALSTQLLNDKVSINGNFDVRGTGGSTANTDQLVGDFDIEYKLTENIRFKVFNRFNNPYTGRQADYTQGLGLFFKQDFDRFSDLFRKKAKSEMKKEDGPEVSEQ
ncbi:MAG: hypothetical protein A2Y71_02400 [Bacteroidetes bacterium RBG_13_42_15]|nr:MAG: hypothetical protein A2Y71_02400 [Bacteroidetes bacterium RBG_13_42_15]